MAGRVCQGDNGKIGGKLAVLQDNWDNLTENEVSTRHGIFHGRTDIVCVKFYLPGVKKSFEHTLLVVN